MAEVYELNPAGRITVGTIGEPGQRTFYLQGSHGSESIGVVIEKEQAIALAGAIDELLEDLEDRYELPPIRPLEISGGELELQLPVEERFRVAQLGLGYDEESGLVILAAQSITMDEEEEPGVARFWISRDQAAALAIQARETAGQGRPLCPLCNQPMDAEGHFCPRTNGHQ